MPGVEFPHGSIAIVDTSVLYAMGGPSNEKYRAFEEYVTRRDVAVRMQVVDRADTVAAGGECRAEVGPVVDGLGADEFVAEAAVFIDEDAAGGGDARPVGGRLRVTLL